MDDLKDKAADVLEGADLNDLKDKAMSCLARRADMLDNVGWMTSGTSYQDCLEKIKQ